MTDLDIVMRCAIRMGYCFLASKAGDILKVRDTSIDSGDQWVIYNPLHDDAQAMALVKKFGLSICYDETAADTHRWESFGKENKSTFAKDLNRAICECVAALPDN